MMLEYIEPMGIEAHLEHSHKVPGSNGSRNGVEGRDFVKLWYEGVILLWNENPNFGT